jgi:hypothetical protein
MTVVLNSRYMNTHVVELADPRPRRKHVQDFVVSRLLVYRAWHFAVYTCCQQTQGWQVGHPNKFCYCVLVDNKSNVCHHINKLYRMSVL